jgi:hypothetical protein
VNVGLLSGAFENNLGLTITLTYDDESTIRGDYDTINNRIELNAAYLQNAEQAREVLMHELVHALTRERFQDPESGIVGKTIAVLDKWLGVLGISGVDSTVDKLIAIRDKVALGSKSLFDTFNNIIEAVRSGDETRLDELYAEAFSNKEFAELLKSQTIESIYDLRREKVKVNSSIWQKFLSVILEELAYTITRFVSGKSRQISILNELALILNDNPAFIETPEETTKKLAGEKELEDKKIVKSQPVSPIATTVNAPTQSPAILTNSQTSSNDTEQPQIKPEPVATTDKEDIDEQINRLNDFVEFLKEIIEDYPTAVKKTQDQAKKDKVVFPKSPNLFYKYLVYHDDFDNTTYYLQNNNNHEGIAYDREGNKYTFKHTTYYEKHNIDGKTEELQTGTLVIKDENGKVVSKKQTNWEKQHIQPPLFEDIRAIKKTDIPDALDEVRNLKKQKNPSSSQESVVDTAPEKENDTTPEEEQLLSNNEIEQEIIEKEEKLKVLENGLNKLKDYSYFWISNIYQNNFYDHVIFTHGEKTFYLIDEDIKIGSSKDTYKEILERKRVYAKTGRAYDEKGNSYIFIYESNSFNKYENRPELVIYEYEKQGDNFSPEKPVYIIKNTILDIKIDNPDASNTWQFEKGKSKTNFKAFSNRDKKQAEEKEQLAQKRIEDVQKQISELRQEIKDLRNPKISQTTPTIDLTKQTFVATPITPQESNNLPELKTGEIDNFSPEAPMLLENNTVNKVVIDPNIEDPEEEIVLDVENGNLVTTKTTFDNIELEEAIKNLQQEVSLLFDDIQKELQIVIDELLQEDGAIETKQLVAPSSKVVEFEIINPDIQAAINEAEGNAEAMKKNAEINVTKKIEELKEEKAKKDEEPKVLEEGKPKKTKTVKPDSPAIVIPDSELAEKVNTDKPIIIQDNGNGTNDILPAKINDISGVPHATLDAEPFAQNVPNSVIKTDTAPIDSKAPERKDNAAMSSKEPVIEKQGIPIDGSNLQKDLIDAEKAYQQSLLTDESKQLEEKENKEGE